MAARWVGALPPLPRLLALVVALPFLLTYAHLLRESAAGGLCFVGPAAAEGGTTAGTALASLRSSAAMAEARPGGSGEGASAPLPLGPGPGPGQGPDPTSLHGTYAPSGGWEGAPLRLVRRPGANKLLPAWGWPGAAEAASSVSVAVAVAVAVSVSVEASASVPFPARPDPGASGPSSSSSMAPLLDPAGGEGGRWCLRSRDGPAGDWALCSEGGGPLTARPPNGVWSLTRIGGDGMASEDEGEGVGGVGDGSVRVSCPASSSSFLAPSHPTRPHPVLDQVLNRPATTLLLCVNLYLAYRYWEARTRPDAVAKVYSRMAGADGELWRAFTGAFAHFEPLHLGFNMMALHALGLELEEARGSVGFLLWNVSLVVLTSAAMMAMTWGRIRWAGRGTARAASLAETSTVGYSGVLFAWAVVAALDRPSNCPVPLLPDLCFRTRGAPGGRARFSAAPFVQLALAQLVMPRASLVGHLAGVACGHLLHLGALGLEWACPQVLVPAVMLGHLWRVRGMVPVRDSSSSSSGGGGGGIGADGEVVGLVPAEEDGEGDAVGEEAGDARHRLHRWARDAMLALAMVSPLVLDWKGSPVLAQLVTLALFDQGARSHALRSPQALGWDRAGWRQQQQERRRSGLLWRAALLSLTLLIVADSMTLAGWAVGSVHIEAERRVLLGLGPAAAFLLGRTAANVVALALAAEALHLLGEVGEGPLPALLRPVPSLGRDVGGGMLGLAMGGPRVPKSSWGEGRRLGAT